jgi:hypothetical protein
MKRDIVLFVNAIRPATFKALEAHAQQTGQQFVPIVIVDKKIQTAITERNGQQDHAHKVRVINADFDSASSIRQALRPYDGRIYAVTAQYENSIHELKKLIPYLPYLPLPTEKSLDWATEKKLMREMLEAYDPSLVPRYQEVHGSNEEDIQHVENSLTYPLIVKPSGLEGSLLVSMVRNTEELRTTLEHTFKEVQKGYDMWIKRHAPVVLVEEFMEGDMYSIDTYLSHDGTPHHTPLVKVITGQKVGFDDFFGYARLTPVMLSEEEMGSAYATAEKACHALGLRSVTAHVELMKTPTGWKIIELGPRIGGYRHDIYDLSYGINHIVNDILIRGGDTPYLPSSISSHTAVLNIYARFEGNLQHVDGLQILNELPSYISHRQVIAPGELARFAKNNGDPVLEVTLSHEDKSQLETDIVSIEDGVRPVLRI